MAEKYPSLSVVTVTGVLEIVTCAPLIGAPLASRTVPEIVVLLLLSPLSPPPPYEIVNRFAILP